MFFLIKLIIVNFISTAIENVVISHAFQTSRKRTIFLNKSFIVYCLLFQMLIALERRFNITLFEKLLMFPTRSIDFDIAEGKI